MGRYVPLLKIDCTLSVVNERGMELIVGIAQHTYKSTLPTRLPTRNILTTTTIRRSLSTINQLESIRDSEEGSTGKRGSLEPKSRKTGQSQHPLQEVSKGILMIDTGELAYETID